MSKKIYIAESIAMCSVRQGQDEGLYGAERFFTPKDFNARNKLMGLELSPDDVVVIGDPAMPYSFWQTLQTRIRKPATPSTAQSGEVTE